AWAASTVACGTSDARCLMECGTSYEFGPLPGFSSDACGDGPDYASATRNAIADAADKVIRGLFECELCPDVWTSHGCFQEVTNVSYAGGYANELSHTVTALGGHVVCVEAAFERVSGTGSCTACESCKTAGQFEPVEKPTGAGLAEP